MFDTVYRSCENRAIMATTTTAEPQKRAQAVSLRGYTFVLVSTLLMSTTGILIKVLLTDYGMEPLALAFLRVLIVSSALGLVLFLFKRSYFQIQRRHLVYFVLMGILGVGLHQLLWVTSVSLNGAGVATVLVYVQPTIVALISIRFLGEKLDRNKAIALILTLLGIILVSQAYNVNDLDVNGLGILVGVGTGFTWAAYALFGRYTSLRYPAWTSLLYAFFFGTLFLLPLQLLVRDPLSLGTNWGGWAVLFFLSLGPTLGGFGLYTVGLSQVPASIVTLLGTLEPVFTIVIAYFLFGEQLDPAQMLGAALILFSVILLRPKTPTETFDS
jgi:drug/metabolite transporter (DMT)-like permease